MSYSFWAVQRQRMAWPWNWGRDRSRSLKMGPFDRSYTTFCWSAIVSIDYVVPLSINLTLNNRDLERGHWRSFKLVSFEILGAVSYSPSIVTMAVFLTQRSASENSVTLKTWLGVLQGHWKRRRSIDHIRFSIGPPLQIWLYLVQFLSYFTLNNIVTLKSGSEVTQGHLNWYHSKVWVRFPICFHSNYISILHHFRDKARYWSKIVIFSYSLAFNAPVRRSPSEYCHSVCCEKPRMVKLRDGKKIVRICITVLTEYRRVTDRRTDRQTYIYLATT